MHIAAVGFLSGETIVHAGSRTTASPSKRRVAASLLRAALATDDKRQPPRMDRESPRWL